ncbi:NAD(P)-dependent oxidoreductase [Candidatus Pacearchaeota archaeon]|nr:NAD(P)-dependent oxidoreductase [Candidatus Pacearchaeota archaeon]
MVKKKVLVLGATGRIGPGFLEEYFRNYRKDYELILGYHRTKPENNLESRKINLSDIESLKKAMKEIDVVVNLAANSNQNAEFSELIEPNLIGAYNVFQAALDSKVKRVVFASSVHSIRGYELGKEVKHDDVPKPITFYGATKVFGEALCHVFSEKGLSCLAIRIGAYLPDKEREVVCYTRDFYDYVISQRDFAQLLSKCILAPEKIKFGILSGISNNKRKYMDLKFTKELVGYNPEDDAFEICEEIKRREK